MTSCHAWLLKGWLLGRSDVPDEIMAAVEMLAGVMPTPVQPVAAEPPIAPAVVVVREDDPIAGDPQPASTATVSKQRRQWTPEARAAAADRMRAMQAAKRERRAAPGEARAPSKGGA